MKKKENLFDKGDPSISRKRKILEKTASENKDYVLPGIVEVSSRYL